MYGGLDTLMSKIYRYLGETNRINELRKFTIALLRCLCSSKLEFSACEMKVFKEFLDAAI